MLKVENLAYKRQREPLICTPNASEFQSENLESLKKNPNTLSRLKNIRSPKKRGKREKHLKKIARKR